MKQHQKSGSRNETGATGEKIAANYLRQQGMVVLSTNYYKKWGEIDIVARETFQNRQIVRFVEVKTVSYETKHDLKLAVTHGTWRPEENVHFKKIQRLNRTLESWISEFEHKGDWEIDVIAVRIVSREKYATVKHLRNIVLD